MKTVYYIRQPEKTATDEKSAQTWALSHFLSGEEVLCAST